MLKEISNPYSKRLIENLRVFFLVKISLRYSPTLWDPKVHHHVNNLRLWFLSWDKRSPIQQTEGFLCVKSWTTLDKNINIVCWLLFLKGGICVPVPKRNRMRLFGSITPPPVEHAIPNLAYSSLHNNAAIPDAVYKEKVVAAQWRTKYVANCWKLAACLSEATKQTGKIF